ncbi:hypothetical protein Thena_0863 [Thermodesulfobium narugense DSM 14796]|uniref:Uncharacterized protein n=1 Tax=Thermodesulfobium narugense DSM 14796 TaxID=747365 RepID=M1E750_9BACT|nr:hypothetical protein [Thermodesulfobium narugense]AEE14493.1 hypothetical protein Thena_0863 [Thermodesulfobium narugense DSM 14796]
MPLFYSVDELYKFLDNNSKNYKLRSIRPGQFLCHMTVQGNDINVYTFSEKIAHELSKKFNKEILYEEYLFMCEKYEHPMALIKYFSTLNEKLNI